MGGIIQGFSCDWIEAVMNLFTPPPHPPTHLPSLFPHSSFWCLSVSHNNLRASFHLNYLSEGLNRLMVLRNLLESNQIYKHKKRQQLGTRAHIKWILIRILWKCAFWIQIDFQKCIMKTDWDCNGILHANTSDADITFINKLLNESTPLVFAADYLFLLTDSSAWLWWEKVLAGA